MKREFWEHIDRSTVEVEQFSDEILLNTTVLDDLYIYGTHLADRRADRQLLEEFDEVSRKLEQTNSSKDYEKVIILEDTLPTYRSVIEDLIHLCFNLSGTLWKSHVC